MRSFLPVRRDAAGDSIELTARAFGDDCRAGVPSLERFWAGLASKQTASTLAALVKVDLQRRFQEGQRPKVIEYLERFPILAESSDRVVSLVYEEFCLLEESGEHPDCREFCELYGPWRDSLASQLAYHRELSRAVGAESPAVTFPEVGERFDKYQLHSILGVGGVARVFLATEDDLGGRQLAIKVSAFFGQEPSILGKLDHRNIVPILTVAQSESGLRGICMPYRPGVTLEDLIRRIGRKARPRSARAIFDSLTPLNPKAPLAPDEQRVGWADFPIHRTFPEAVAWIGLALANALSYLHEQGVYHRDIKPANVLMAYREGPQLLDFNLAQDPSRPDGASAAQKGGTLPYMAPEQLKAFLDPSAWEHVESAADLFSLGLVLRELLTGQPPEVTASKSSLPRDIQALIDRRSVPLVPIRDINPGVPPALESIIVKCLAFRPSDRYAAANDLAWDLKRFLDRKPLDHAPNPSATERAINWLYRNRQFLAATMAFLFAALVVFQLWAPRAEDGREVFKAAEKHLDDYIDTRRKEHLEKARDAFENLREEYPTSARAALGLGLSLYKLKLTDPKSKSLMNSLVQEGLRRPDAEEFLEERLEKEPNEATLLLNLGCVLTVKGEYDRARGYLDRAVKLDPLSFAALNGLGDLESKTNHPDEAIRLFERAVKAGEGKKLDSWRIYESRFAALVQYQRLIDRLIEARSAGEDGTGTSGLVEKMQTTLKMLKRDWEKMGQANGGQLHQFYVAYFEGCILSMRAALDATPDDPARPSKLFEKARCQFDLAKKSIAPESELEARNSQLEWMEDQERKLEDRRRTPANP